MTNNVRVRLIIKGKVQGVWYRDSTRKEAVRLGVSGWVKNRPDGHVEVLAEGPEDNVKNLVTWCHHGPTHARVSEVEETPEGWQGEFDSFDVVF
jgi:acylphosphatase